MTVGFAGIRRIGLAMARCLPGAGFLPTVGNRNTERCAPLVAAGAAAVDDPAAIGHGSDVVVTMVADSAAARSVPLESRLLDCRPPCAADVTAAAGGRRLGFRRSFLAVPHPARAGWLPLPTSGASETHPSLCSANARGGAARW